MGGFVQYSDWFAEWNCPFRDDGRLILKGDAGMVVKLAARIPGSPDLYQQKDTDNNRSVNFITCQDSLTLNQLVSYLDEYNGANRENSQAGANESFSWNRVEEGETDNADIAALRLRQIRNFLTVLFLYHVLPLLLMPDVVRLSQHGHNNTYCQDNEMSWFGWSPMDAQADLSSILRRLIDFNQGLERFRQETRLLVASSRQAPHLIWHGIKIGQPDGCFHRMLNGYR